MGKSICKSFGTLSILTLCFLLVDIQCFASTFKKPAIVIKKIHRQTDNNKFTNAQSTSKVVSQKMSLSPKSDISVIHSPARIDQIHTAKYKKDNNTRPLYNPSGKLNPFEPLFAVEPEKHTGPITPVIEPTGIPTEIQKFNLKQLKLTGVILAISGNKALVREPAGKGHIITIGTKIGNCGGKVVSISNDKVIVEEKWKDHFGKIDIHHKELRLIRNTGKL